MELLTPERYGEFDEFIKNHPQSCFTQCTDWRHVKDAWQLEGVISRGADGSIRGAVAVLVQRIPFMGASLMYAPRGPVCDLHDREVIADLLAGVRALAKKHRAYEFKMDPDVLMADTEFLEIARQLGFEHFYGPDGFETIQARFNYRLYIGGRSEEEVLASFHQKTRYNIRVAQRHGVEVRVEGKEALGEFMRLMRLTGSRDGFSIRPQVYFERMLDALGEHVRLYMAYYDGRAVSGAITTCYGNKACYVYGASDNEHRNVMPNYLIQWEMIRWALECGCELYDFQGVSGTVDESAPIYGLYRFKKGFSGTLDELAGEFNLVLSPFKKQMVETALGLRVAMRKRRRGG